MISKTRKNQNKLIGILLKKLSGSIQNENLIYLKLRI